HRPGCGQFRARDRSDPGYDAFLAARSRRVLPPVAPVARPRGAGSGPGGEAGSRVRRPAPRGVQWRKLVQVAAVRVRSADGSPLRGDVTVESGGHGQILTCDDEGRAEVPFFDGCALLVGEAQHRTQKVAPASELEVRL